MQGSQMKRREKVWRGVHLKLGTNIIHVHSWNTHAFDSNCFSKFPMIMNNIQHVVS